jgi:hypothetical protein
LKRKGDSEASYSSYNMPAIMAVTMTTVIKPKIPKIIEPIEQPTIIMG